MSESGPFIPFYTSDFLGGTGGMTAAQKGVYITLLCLMYEEEGSISTPYDMLARRCGCTLPSFKKTLATLCEIGKIQILEDGLWSDKCDKHITQRHERRTSAKAAAVKRWEKDKQKQGPTDADAMPAQCYPEPEPYNPPVPTVQSPPKQKKATRLPDDWKPTSVEIDFAKQEGFSENEIIRECGKFRDYWHGVGGQRGTKRDWTATWRNWIRRAADDRGSRPQRGGNSGKRSAILAAAAIGLDRGGREHGEPGDAVADVRDAGSGGSGAGGGGDSGGDGSGKPRGRAEGLNQAAAGDKGAGHGPGRNGDGERSDFRGTDGFSGGRGAGCVIDVEPDGDIFSAAGRDSGSVSPENGQSGAASCGDGAGAGKSGRSAVIDLDVLRRMG